MPILCFVIISKSRLTYNLLSSSGNTSFASDIKKPAEIGLVSEAIILTGYFTILRDFIVLIPAGAEAPGTKIVEFEPSFKWYSLPK
jgi:hypothetical protein